ncbi:MAG: DUF2147 domain-containing protein [Reinekea sp.]|jgi:uncharacterized protein (DUF2147 family)|nr:DUF2147 domain-containing protein [Reinekea sp.]MDX1475825.1 DUF2147 domain-containing protein [Reinekea sp.]
MKKILSTLLLMTWASISMAASMSPEGVWKTIDDETGEEKSIVTVWIENGELMGRIDTLLNPSEPNPTCDDCKGKRKGQLIEGMTFVWGLTQDGDEWKGGTILDPGNGKEYKAKLKVIDNGTKLEVRGFIGFALIGRTQVWERAQ